MEIEQGHSLEASPNVCEEEQLDFFQSYPEISRDETITEDEWSFFSYNNATASRLRIKTEKNDIQIKEEKDKEEGRSEDDIQIKTENEALNILDYICSVKTESPDPDMDGEFYLPNTYEESDEDVRIKKEIPWGMICENEMGNVKGSILRRLLERDRKDNVDSNLCSATEIKYIESNEPINPKVALTNIFEDSQNDTREDRRIIEKDKKDNVDSYRRYSYIGINDPVTPKVVLTNIFKDSQKCVDMKADASKVYKCRECNYECIEKRYLTIHSSFEHEPPTSSTSEIDIKEEPFEMDNSDLFMKEDSSSECKTVKSEIEVKADSNNVEREYIFVEDSSHGMMKLEQICVDMKADATKVCKVYKCPDCDYECSDKQYLTLHSSFEHKFPTFSASEIMGNKISFGRERRNKKSVKGISDDHIEEGVQNRMFKCSKCRYETSNKGNLKKHSIIHTKTGFYVTYKDKREKNVNSSNRVIKNYLRCTKCHFKCKDKQLLTFHIFSHSNITPISLQNYERKRNKILKAEESDRDEFSGSQKTRDEFSGSQKTRDEFSGSQKTRDEFSGSHKTTDEFSGFYKTRNKFSDSQKTRDEFSDSQKERIKKSFKCPICKHDANNEGSLKKHLSFHSKRKVPKYYDSSYDKKNELNLSLLIPSDKETLSCPECEYECRDKSYLRMHFSFEHNFGSGSRSLQESLSRSDCLTHESLVESKILE